MRVVLTAGHDAARHVIALAELLTRRGHVIAQVLVVSPFSVSRARALARRRGPQALRQAARRWMQRGASSERDELEALCVARAIHERSLARWCRSHVVAYSSLKSLDCVRAARLVAAAAPDVVVYGGGGILRPAFLAAARERVLNAHSGPLPEVRGMHAAEWSILLGLAPCVTIHAIDRGLDTGAVFERIPVALAAGDDLELLRSRCVRLGVEGLLRAVERSRVEWPVQAPARALTRQRFVLAPALRELCEARLAARVAASAAASSAARLGDAA